MENIVGLFQMFIEPFKLELKFVSFHSANKASRCLVLFYRTFLFSNLREFVNNGTCEYLFDDKGSKDDVGQIKNHFNVDCVSVLIILWDIAIQTLASFEIKFVVKNKALIQALTNWCVILMEYCVGDKSIEVVEHEEDTSCGEELFPTVCNSSKNHPSCFD